MRVGDEEDDNDDHYYDGDVPWAEPSIREQYEAALGRFILAHNECDMRVTQLIQGCLKRLDDPPSMKKLLSGSFAARVETLTMLQSLPIKLDLGGVPTKRLLEINTHRNVIAHGHFDQNPFDGDYVLITPKKRHDDYSTERLNELSEELSKIARYMWSVIAFYDPPIEMEH